MSSYTFSLTVESLDTPMTPEVTMEYIRLRLESQDVLALLNIVRDY